MKKVPISMLAPPLLAGLLCTTYAAADWVQFVDETATRLIAEPDLGANDQEEKDYDWGDLNNNGWIDLVVVRKQPFTSPGRRVNVLFMNEEGILVDRTAEYATDSDVPGDEGFQTETNDRDIRVVDVDNDGWLDLVTATTLSNGAPKHISYPRVYINKGNNARGDWQGFRYEDARIPQFEGNDNTGAPHAPRFCSVGAGDVTGNGYADLYFGDYDSGCFGCGNMTLDFGDRLLINDGTGHFQDETTSRLQPSWVNSNFGTQSIIVDMNGNGVKDIIQVHSLGGYEAAIVYNNPDNEGFFQSRQAIAESSPYFAMVGDLNNNGRLDVVIADDGNDRWRINQGNLPNGQINWSSTQFLSQAGFRSNIVLADLNNNSWLDILVADVDVDLGSCSGSQAMDMYRHNTNPNNVNFTFDRGNLPVNSLRRTFDMAVFDLTGNGWNDLVVGRCFGTNVFINQPLFGINFDYPNGRPTVVDAEEVTTIEVELTAFGQDLVSGSATLHYAVDGGSYSQVAMSQISGDTYAATIPELDCLSRVTYYVSGELSGGGVVTDPVDAPTSAYSAVAATEIDVAFFDDIEGPVNDWSIYSDASLTGGEWEQAVPVGTVFGGNLASPDGDASPDPNGQAFTTENCQPGEFPGTCNVQHGPTYLEAPAIDLTDADAIINYDRWFFCSSAGDPNRADSLLTQVSNDGGQTWITVDATTGTNSEWEGASFLVSDFVTPTGDVRVRFVAEDAGNQSITNAGIDNFEVLSLSCDGPTPVCQEDLNGDGVVDVSDLLILLANWGECSGDCTGDINNDGVVNVADMLMLLSAWGACD